MHRPQLYARHSPMQRADAERVLGERLHLVAVAAGDAVLDAGAGDGRTTVDVLLPRLPAGVGRVVAGDVSEEMVEFARRRHRGKAEFVHMDLGDGRLGGRYARQFDHVFSFYCLHWVRDLGVAFKNIHDMLKPGGDLLVTFLASHPIYELFERISENIRWTQYGQTLPIPAYYKCKNHKEYLGKILDDVGFAKYQCIVEDRTFEFENCDVLERSIAAVDPVREKLPSTELKKYMQDILEEIKKLKNVRFEPCINNNEERVIVEYKLYVVYARKRLVVE